jgi:hypothetical protein
VHYIARQRFRLHQNIPLVDIANAHADRYSTVALSAALGEAVAQGWLMVTLSVPDGQPYYSLRRKVAPSK